ncbi:MAG: hypothetical protein JXA10_06060 [Anaerolineae bacterium]|nr:hypothetical protein [Anaerolineae bacterium]
MSFFEQTSALKPMHATLLIPGYQLVGDLEVLGMVQTFLNDETKGTFTIKNVTVYGLEPHNPAASMQIRELYVRKDQTLALAFDAEIPRDETGLMPRTEHIAAYTSHYVVQGHYHMGADALVGDFISSTRSQFVGATNVVFFPLFHARAAVIQSASLVYVYAKAVRMHHLV